MQKKIQILPAVVMVAAAIALIFRAFQILVVVDYYEMGFFSASAGFLPTGGLYLLLAVAVIALIAGAIIDKKLGCTAYTRPAASLTSKQTAILGVSFLIGACLRFYELVFRFNGFGLSFIGEAVIFVLLTAIGFIILGSRSLKPVVGYLHIIICISCTLKAAALFMQDTIIIRVSDELLLLLSYVGSVLFFLALGRFIAGNESKLTRHKLLIFGGCTAVLALCASLAGYIALAVDSDYMADHMSMHPLSETGTAVIAVAVIIILYSKSSLPVEEETENGESDETAEA